MEKLEKQLGDLDREQRDVQRLALTALKRGDIHAAIQAQQHVLTVQLRIAETRLDLFRQNTQPAVPALAVAA